MRIHLCSDLHHEFGNYYFPEIDCDTIVITGDIDSNPSSLIKYLKKLSKNYDNIIFTLGNHDFYNSSINDRIRYIEVLLKDIKRDNIHFLNNSSTIIDGIKFYGGTCWSNCDTPFEFIIENSIADFRLIDNFTVNQMRIEHEKFKRNFIDCDVVISHFVPSYEFLDERFINSPLNPYFINSDLQMYHDRVKLWLFGHTHSYHDKKINDTRFVCNPFGYPNEKCNFNKELVIEL